MAFALVFDEKVTQIEDTIFPVHPNLTWIDMTGESPQPKVGWGYDGSFSAPIPSAPTPVPSDEDVYNSMLKHQRAFKAYILAVNDGSIVPGSNMTGAALKAAVKAKM